MDFGTISSNPLSVAEVIGNPDLANQYVAVHGIIYYGEGCEEREILLLPKEGPFDGKPIPKPKSLDRRKCLLIEPPDIYDDFYAKLGSFAMLGSCLWNVNAILVGQIRHRPEFDQPVRIGALWLMIVQEWQDFGGGKFHHILSVSAFPQNSLPQLPWSGPQTERCGQPVIYIHPPQ